MAVVLVLWEALRGFVKRAKRQSYKFVSIGILTADVDDEKNRVGEVW